MSLYMVSYDLNNPDKKESIMVYKPGNSMKDIKVWSFMVKYIPVWDQTLEHGFSNGKICVWVYP